MELVSSKLRRWINLGFYRNQEDERQDQGQHHQLEGTQIIHSFIHRGGFNQNTLYRTSCISHHGPENLTTVIENINQNLNCLIDIYNMSCLLSIIYLCEGCY